MYTSTLDPEVVAWVREDRARLLRTVAAGLEHSAISTAEDCIYILRGAAERIEQFDPTVN